MAVSRAIERRVLTDDQFDLVSRTHHPEIYHADAKALLDLQRKLRDQHSKVRTQVRQRQREVRGKADPRGGSFPAATEQPLRRKQALSAALKRVNRELERVRVLEARTAHVEAARRALALHRRANFDTAAPASRTAGEGMQPISSSRRRRIIPGSQIGSVSQATKVAQAIKDHRGQ